MDIPATVTSKGQITIPVEIRRALDLHPGDRVVFRLDDGQATFSTDGVKALSRNVELAKIPDFFDLAGSVPTPEDIRGLPWPNVRIAAWKAAAEECT